MACLMITAMAAVHGPALAQETASSGTFLGRLILGAGQQKVAIDTPQSVTAVEQEDLDREQPQTVGQVFRNVPGVQIAGSDRPLGFAFNIRGIGATEQTASEARIIVNVDGVPKFYEQYRMGSFFSDPELYRRVEVLRGPGSATLYGSGAIGGAVNFETKDAGDFIPEGGEGALRLRFGIESNGNGRLFSGIYASQPVEGAEFLAALNYRTADSYQDGDGNTVQGTDFAAPSGLLKGTFALAENQTLRLSWQRFTSDADGAAYAQTGGAGAADVFGLVDRNVQDDTLSLDWRMEGGAWLNPHVQLAYSDTTVIQENARSTTGTARPCFPYAASSNVFCDTEYAYRTAMLKFENTGETSGAGWDAFLTYGVQFTNQQRVADSAGPIGFHPEGQDRKVGLYAQGEFVIADRLTLIPGARIDLARRTAGADVPGGSEVEDQASALTFAALYDLTEDLSVFGSVARTERLPTLDELYSWSATKAPALDLETETALSFETGLAFSRQDVLSAGDSLELKVTVFRNSIENLITTTPATDTVYFRNLAEAEFTGGEIEAGYEADHVFARLAYARARGEDSTYGYTLATSPADNLALTLGGRLPDRGLEFGWRGTFVQEITTATRSTTTGVITPTTYPGYTLHDLFVSWKPQSGPFEGFEVQLAMENALDESYRNNLSLDEGRGRTVKLTLGRVLTW